jgi:hypothetical protein
LAAVLLPSGHVRGTAWATPLRTGTTFRERLAGIDAADFSADVYCASPPRQFCLVFALLFLFPGATAIGAESSD